MATQRQALRPVAVLDAAVLVPAGLRDLLLSCADVGVFRPVWRSELEAETMRNVARLRITRSGAAEDDTHEYALRMLSAMHSAFPDARLPDADWRGKAAAMTNDLKDRHVLAAAVAAGATHVVTLNLRDFPPVSRPAGVLVQAPDRFLLERLREDASAVRRAVEAMAG
ncbi:MAG: PIN domain-containing protein, partial [Jatrophihabitans sp.]